MMNKNQEFKLNQILSKVGDTSFRRRVMKILEYLDIKPGDRILDCGCGEGFYTMIIKELYGSECDLISMDMDFELVKKASSWLNDKTEKKFYIADVGKLPFKNSVFDKIIFSEVLEHVEDDEHVLVEIKRVFKDSGTIAVTVPNHNYPLLWDPFNKIRESLGLGHFSPDNGFWGGLWAMHLRLYYLQDIIKLIESVGFKVNDKSMITHYCLPFNHNILYVGKRLGSFMPIPKSLSESMEKFEWKTKQDSVFYRFIQFCMKIINIIDKKNDKAEKDYNKSSVCIACKVLKQ
ncbi:MAG: methyltransferase domain-containing protein [Candidatus Ancaeobacter aquaticus]|nr:methyltransferase domain-containing protein [Candidatus Ancaeobacter aquaticus]